MIDKDVWDAVKGMRENKVPSIDGFNAKFFKSGWNVVKRDVVEAIQNFFTNNRLYVAVNCALVTLIPKNKDVNTMKETRPIAYCSIIYNIISRIFTYRLSKVITNIIHDNQTTFIPGKTIHENIIMTHELLRGYNRKHIPPSCTIQMDLQKEYDTVNWDALEMIMREMSFPTKFVNWIMIAVKIVFYRYEINGQVSNILKARRGLRQ